ncbi:rhodanese-like domain-containing protein [Salinispira pacifica]
MGQRSFFRFRFAAAGVALALLLFASCATAAPRAETRTGLDYTDPATLQQLVEQGGQDYLLLDVRTPAEFASGHIPTAQNLPYDQIIDSPPSGEKDRLVITYCASGRRAEIAKDALETLGFTNVVNFGAVGDYPGSLVTGK